MTTNPINALKNNNTKHTKQYKGTFQQIQTFQTNRKYSKTSKHFFIIYQKPVGHILYILHILYTLYILCILYILHNYVLISLLFIYYLIDP